MSYKACKKCNLKFQVKQLVQCKNCNGCFDRKCARELCDEAGEWAIPPTKLVKWSCTECQSQPARVCCDACDRALGGSRAFVACGKCGRHHCAPCAGLSKEQLLRLRRAHRPWLCKSCCESSKDVPHSWNKWKNFSEEYVRFPALWKPDATQSELTHAYESLGRALGLPQAEAARECQRFRDRVTALLSSLAFRFRSIADIKQVAPAWLRETEKRVNWLPAIMQSIWRPDKPEDVLLRLARRIRRVAHGRYDVWSEQCVRSLAAELACHPHRLKDVWSQTIRVALHKLQSLTLVGDNLSALSESARLRRYEWLAVDAALLHTSRRVGWLVGYLKSQVLLLHLLLRLVQQYCLESSEYLDVTELRARWVCAYREYCSKGLITSLIVLQRRWWELKMETRVALLRRAHGDPVPLLSHHRLLASRYPHVVTKNFRSWNALRRAHQVVDLTEEEVQKFQGQVIPVPVAEDDLILQEARIFETPDEPPAQEVTVKPDPHTRSQQILNAQPWRQHENCTQISGQYGPNTAEDSLELLKEPDPKIASACIIFDSDSEEDKLKSSRIDKDSDDDCVIVDRQIETCELSDDNDSDELNKDGNDDVATDPKLQMIPVVSLVRIDEQNKRDKSKTPKHSLDNAISALINQINRDTTENVQTNNEGTSHTTSKDVAIQDDINTLRKHLIGYKIPDDEEEITEEVEAKESKIEVDVVLPDKSKEVGPSVRPWNYKGPLTGKVEDLSWLCTAVSVTLEKLPELVLNNVKATSASRRVWLPDIEQVRRHNRRLLVAQVAPLHRSAEVAEPTPRRVSRVHSVESTSTNKSCTSSLEDFVLHNRPADEENFEEKISNEQLSAILNDHQLRKPGPIHCCLARRHRVYNDARRTNATRAGRGDTCTDVDVHDARHGKPPYDCECCCLHLLEHSASQSLVVLQRVLAKSLDTLLKKRGETPASSDSQHSEQATLPLGTAVRRSSSSSDDERLVIDEQPAEQPRRSSRTHKRRNTSVESDKSTSRDKPQRKTSRDESKTQTQRQHQTKQQKPTKQKKRTKKGASDEERRKREDYKEWMRQKNSHRRYFLPPGSNTIIYMSKKTDSIITKQVINCPTPVDFVSLNRPDILDHTYANKVLSETDVCESEFNNELVIKKLSNPSLENISVMTVSFNNLNASLNQTATSSQTITKDRQSMDVEITQSDTLSNLVSSVASEPIITNEFKLLNGTLMPMTENPNLVQSSDVAVTSGSNQAITPLNPSAIDQPASYFMIYQEPNVAKEISGPAVAIVPVTITGPSQVESQHKSIFQENFRQKMVHNLSLLTGGIPQDENEKDVGTIVDTQIVDMDTMEHQIIDQAMQNELDRAVSPKIFDDLEPRRITTARDVIDTFQFAPIDPKPVTEVAVPLPVAVPSTPVMIPSAPVVIPSAPIVIPSSPVAIPSSPMMIPSAPVVVPPSPVVIPSSPVMIPSSPLVIPSTPIPVPGAPIMVPAAPDTVPTVPLMIPTVPVMVEPLPEAHELTEASLPTISNVTSLAQPIINVDDDDDGDDDCIITSPPPPTTRTIIIKPKKQRRPGCVRFIKPASLYDSVPEHISTYVRGWGTSPFALLRLNSEKPLWVLPGRRLVLTDAAVACRHIKYFIINSKELNRMVPVHFDPSPPCAPAAPPARIQVRSFAKLPETAPPPNDMLMADNKLYKRLADDPPIYARVLTALTEVMSARLLASSGYSLHVYSRQNNSLLALRPAGRVLHCADLLAAQYVADCFNNGWASGEEGDPWTAALDPAASTSTRDSLVHYRTTHELP